MRAVSTVVDVTVCLLLVSAAVAALAVPAVQVPAAGADETADALAKTTANVSVQTEAGGRAGHRRRVSGTHAGLLGRAALANLRLDGRPLTRTADEFRAAVANETARVLAWSPQRTSVTAVWEPYGGAPLSGQIRVGSRPPRGVDVSTATLGVPVPVEDCSANASSAADDYDPVGRVVARCVVDVTLPRDAIEMPDPSSPAGNASRRRLRAYEGVLRSNGSEGDVETRVARVEAALAERLTADMRERFESPATAAAAVRTGTVRIVVRAWEP